MISDFIKWFFTRNVIVIVMLVLICIVPFSVLLTVNSRLALVWFIVCEIICPSFGVWYFSIYKDSK